MISGYFVVSGMSKSPEATVFRGDFIVPGEVVVENGSSQRPKALPRIGPLRPFEVKWILGPNGERGAFAEAMGYETVDHDDFRYPPPRI
jgi:hypothetical protein